MVIPTADLLVVITTELAKIASQLNDLYYMKHSMQLHAVLTRQPVICFEWHELELTVR